MCIAILNNGKKLSRQELSNCWTSNDDGAGLLYIEDGKLVAFRQANEDLYDTAGLDFDKFMAEYERVYKMSRASHTPVLLHFRIATHGLTPEYLHPFFISDSVGLIHNGIIRGYGDNEFSDTWEFANELATLPASMTGSVDFLDVPFISGAILDKLANYNKVVFMDDTGEYRIFNAQLGHWSGQNWFSNDAYKTRKAYFGSTVMTKRDPDLLDEKAWNDSFKATSQYIDPYEDDWYGFGKPKGKGVIDDEIFIEDKTYKCSCCEMETWVNEDSCCVDCGAYIIEAEDDVIMKEKTHYVKW